MPKGTSLAIIDTTDIVRDGFRWNRVSVGRLTGYLATAYADGTGSVVDIQVPNFPGGPITPSIESPATRSDASTYAATGPSRSYGQVETLSGTLNGDLLFEGRVQDHPNIADGECARVRLKPRGRAPVTIAKACSATWQAFSVRVTNATLWLCKGEVRQPCAKIDVEGA